MKSREEILEYTRNFIEEATNLDLSHKLRDNDHVFARAVFYKICYDLAGATHKLLGDYLDFDRLSVRHGINNVFPFLEDNLFYRDMYMNCLSGCSDGNIDSLKKSSLAIRGLLEKERKLDSLKPWIDVIESIDSRVDKQQILKKFRNTVTINNRLVDVV